MPGRSGTGTDAATPVEAPRTGRDASCSIARAVAVLGERWTLLIVREAFLGTSTFTRFRAALGIAPDVLSARLAGLVDAGVLEKQAYREDGSRERERYVLTPAGRDLRAVVASLATWGREHVPAENSHSPSYHVAPSGDRVELAFVDSTGRRVDDATIEMVRGA